MVWLIGADLRRTGFSCHFYGNILKYRFKTSVIYHHIHSALYRIHGGIFDLQFIVDFCLIRLFLIGYHIHGFVHQRQVIAGTVVGNR